MSAHIESIGGTQFRLTCTKGRWTAAVWCDCMIGPHWHELGQTWWTVQSARRAIRTGAAAGIGDDTRGEG